MLSVRRATPSYSARLAIIDISIHALREEGDMIRILLSTRLGISIHALREEGDRSHKRYPCPEQNFYPRPPRGGRPDERKQCSERKEISIHALREEGDDVRTNAVNHLEHFYPRPPRGGRHIFTISLAMYNYFYPRPP